MEKLFLPYELAFMLKSKGYNLKCFGYYWDQTYKPEEPKNKILHITPRIANHSTLPTRVSAPIYSQVIDWLYDKHNIEVNTYHITPFEGDRVSIVTLIDFKVFKNRHDIKYIDHGIPDKAINHWEDKYEGLNKGIEEALKLIP